MLNLHVTILALRTEKRVRRQEEEQSRWSQQNRFNYLPREPIVMEVIIFPSWMGKHRVLA
jgi:hypothetical protein